jgi:outer membrane protein TolC
VDQTRATCTPLKALSERADLQAARANVESARDSRRQATAGYLPTLGLSSGLNAFTTEPGPGRVATWSIAAVLSVPLFEGGLREGLVRERAGIEQQAAETLERTRRDVEVEVVRARRSVEVAESLVKTAAESLELAARTDQLTRRAFEVGRGSSLELVQSGASLRQAELLLALREFELVQARLDAFLTEARCDW